MRRFTAGIWVLVLGYTLSQFYRTFLAVLAPRLQQDLGAGPDDLAISSGIWFLAFAAMQVPVGRSLDRIGPRRTAAGLMLVAAAGAAVFASATLPWHLHLAMVLIGIGCSSALMSAYYIFARNYPARDFGMLAGVFVALGASGNLLSAAPLVSLTEAMGWRSALWLMGGLTLAIAAAKWLVVRDPPHLDATHPSGGLREVLRLRALWFILPLFAVNYGASAAIRGLWAGPYLQEVFDASPDRVGQATLLMGLAMIAGNFLAGPAVRVIGSVRRTIIIGTSATMISIAALWLFPASSLGLAVLLLALVGFTGAFYVLMIAHGRAFLPPHLVGRGVTFLNMFSIGGTGLLQFGSRPVYNAATGLAGPAAAYSTLFLFFALPLALGLGLYLLTPEAPDD